MTRQLEAWTGDKLDSNMQPNSDVLFLLESFLYKKISIDLNEIDGGNIKKKETDFKYLGLCCLMLGTKHTNRQMNKCVTHNTRKNVVRP